MKKFTFLKSLLLAIGLLAGNIGAWAQTCDITDDFVTLTTSTSYLTITTTSGWNAVNAAVFEGGPTNSSPKFSFIGPDANTKAVCINGKTTAVGVITSPTLSGGCSSISFKYGHPFSEANGAKFTVEIKQNGTTVWSEQVVQNPMTQYTAYNYTKAGLTITGDFTLVITNNSPSNSSSSNKDRVAIWGICITNYSGATPVPTITVTEVTVPTFSTNVGSSATNTIHVAGTNLTEDIVLEISGTNADQFSVYPISLTPSEGTVAETDVTITYTPTSAGTHTATLTLSSTGATDVTRSLSGTAGLAAPVATEATSAGKTSFIANWEPVTGAEEYEISVYTKTQGTTTASKLFISEYGEGSSGNKKYVEIFNGTGDDVDLSNYVIKKAVNGGGWSGVYNFPASTVLTNGSTFVLANNSTDVIGATAYDGTFCSWNGNDAIGLFKDDVLIDIFGVPDSDPGTGWSVAGITDATKDHILIRKPSITSPTTDWAASAGTTADDSQWIVSDFDYNATDQTTNLGSHTMDGFGTTLHPIAGSPFTVSGTETSKVITGLSPATTYYYKVVAISGSVRSAASNEIAASTLSVGVPSMTLRNIYVRDGKIYVNASAAGQRIEVYNTVGQRLVNVASKEGENEISVPAKGILLVKAGSQVTKVMVP